MPGLTFVFVGKMRERYYIDAFEEYYKRLGAFTKPELREIAEERLPEQQACCSAAAPPSAQTARSRLRSSATSRRP